MLPYPNFHRAEMAYGTSRSVRFQSDIEVQHLAPSSHSRRAHSSSSRAHDPPRCRSLKEKVLSRAFSEDFDSLMHVDDGLLFDPRGRVAHRWNKLFLAACLLSLFVDPLFLYLTGTQQGATCIQMDAAMALALCMVRSLLDVFYVMHVFFRFRTAFVAPSSRVFGRGELVIQPSKIALRYLSRSFLFDIVTALPLPQLVIWMLVPKLKESATGSRKNILRFSMMFQYLPRLVQIFPLSRRIVMATGVMTETAWAGAAYNLILYMLASHVLGALWYLFSVERAEACWREACRLERPSCQYQFLDCSRDSGNRTTWYQQSNLRDMCTPGGDFYQFGIYAEAHNYNLTSSSFVQKYFYCFWWGLKNLSCLGQNLSTSLFVGEISFAIIIAVVGLVLFGLLIGNMQSYLQATMVRLEEWRTKRTDTERWMHHRQLPLQLRQRVRRYHQYRWVATRGVDEEALLKDLSVDLRRDIKRHLCLDLVQRVPLFDEMDDRMLEAICERLRPALYTKGTRLVRELDPVDAMLFIIRGHLDSSTTQGGRSGFLDSCRIGAGDFCGEELLTWALNPRPAAALPLSTRTVRAVSEVEAFALPAGDLRLVAARFRRLHSRQLRHKFRFHSPQWRTWAACFIQAAWRRQRRRRASMELRLVDGPSAAAASVFGRQLVTTSRRSGRGGRRSSDGRALRKPMEPEFIEEEED